MKIFISGDFCPINRAEKYMYSKDAKGVFGELLQNIQEADIAITNLECTLTNHKTKIDKTGVAYKVSANTAGFLKSAGFDLVTLANNHSMDYGEQGLKDTMDVLDDNGIRHVGAGNSENEIGVCYLKVKSKTVAIVNMCENEWSTTPQGTHKAYGLDPVENFNLIREAKQKSDKVIVIHHGGHEFYELPSPRMKKLFRFFVDCGADAVINHHPHCMSGYEVYNDVPVFYSLGTFVLDKPGYRNSSLNKGLAITLEINEDDSIGFELHLYNQFSENPNLEIYTGQKKEAITTTLIKQNELIASDERLQTEFSKYCRQNQKVFNSYIEPRSTRITLALKNRGFFPSLWSKKKRKYLLNLIRCEAHRDVLLDILNRENNKS